MNTPECLCWNCNIANEIVFYARLRHKSSLPLNPVVSAQAMCG